MVNELPVWLNQGVEPPESLKTAGWQPGMKPSAQHMNWLFNRSYMALKELQENGGIANLQEQVDQLEAKVDANWDDFTSHKNEDATLTQKGHVQLSSATDSESETLAATPKAVKQAYDRAEQAFQSASNGKTVIANAVTGKGVPTSASDTFQQMATNISSIKVGKYDSGDVITDAKMILDTTKGRGKEDYLAKSSDYNYLALDKRRGAIYGCSTNASNYLSKHSTNYGSVIWSLTDGVTSVSRCAVDSNGNIYLTRFANNSNLLIISPSGGNVKQVTVSSSNTALCIDKFDNVYIGGYNGTSHTLQKHKLDGTKIWEKAVSGQINSIDCDEQGNVYCGITTGTNSVVKFNKDGIQQWGALAATAIYVKVAPNGNVGVCEGSYTRILEPTNGNTIMSISSSNVTSVAFDSGSYIYTSYRINYETIRRHDSQKGTLLSMHDRLKSLYSASHMLMDDEDKIYASMTKSSTDSRLMKVDMLNYYTII